MTDNVKTRAAPGSFETRMAGQPGAETTVRKLEERILGAITLVAEAAEEVAASVAMGEPRLPVKRPTESQETLLEAVANGSQGVNADLMAAARKALHTWNGALQALREAEANR